jgi:hypothetical protein
MILEARLLRLKVSLEKELFSRATCDTDEPMQSNFENEAML